MVTPELVRPIPAGAPQPQIEFPKELLADGATTPPRTPAIPPESGVSTAEGSQRIVPVEVLVRDQKANKEQTGARRYANENGGANVAGGTTK